MPTINPITPPVKYGQVPPPPPIASPLFNALYWDPMKAPFPLFPPTSDQLELQLTNAESRLKSVRETWTIPAVLDGVLAVLAVAMSVLFHLRTLALGITSLVIFIAAAYIIYRSYAVAATEGHIATLKKQLEQSTRNQATGQQVVAPEGARGGLGSLQIDRLVEINVGNLGSYYGLVVQHAGRSFVVSLGGGILGFGLIVTGLIFPTRTVPMGRRFHSSLLLLAS